MEIRKKTGKGWVVGVTVPDGIVRVRRQGKECWTGNSGRETGSYTGDDQPASGGGETAQSKRLGSLDVNALLGHGATEVLKDAMVLRGNKNEDYWNSLKMGRPLPKPGVPFIYEKFINLLKAGGANVVKKGDMQVLTSLTDKDIDKLSSGEITGSETVDAATLTAKPGGLFDESVTGGTTGCFHPNTGIWTEHGMLTIRYIVDNKLKVRVWSYDFSTKQFQLKPVTNWFKNYASNGIGVARTECRNGRLASVMRRFSPETLWGTASHQVYDRQGQTRDLRTADYLLAATEVPNPTQFQVLVGGLLGDSHIPKQGQLAFKHGIKQKEYMLAKLSVFGAMGHISPDYTDCSGGVKKPRIQCSARTRASKIFADARTRWYTPGGAKYVCREDVENLDWLGLAVWFFDDGSIGRHGGNKLVATLCTNCFSKDDVVYLQDFLSRRFGLHTTLTRERRYQDKTYGWQIVMASTSARKLIAGVAPYAVPCMQYKVSVKPHIRYCRYCGVAINPRFRTCAHCMITIVVSGLGSAKLPKEARQRFGNSDNCRKMAAGLLPVPDDSVDIFGKWLSGLNIGSCLSVFYDSKFNYELIEVPSRFEKGFGRKWENTGTVYDIEVAGLHNYFAGGYLVSNSRWGHVTLATPIVNPAMEEPVRRLLGLTVKEFTGVMSGRTEINGLKSPEDVLAKLADIEKNKDAKIEYYRNEAMNGRGARRDDAVKCLRYLDGSRKQGMPITSWMLSKVPVIPPIFRPVSRMGDVLMVADMNDLYRDLIETNNHIKEARLHLPESELADEKEQLYDSVSAVFGWGEPITSEGRAKRLKGAVRQIIGENPKHGLAQSRLFSKTMDMVARGTIAPDPELDMDSIGLPAEKAWQLYKPFVMRKLVQRGFPPIKAKEMIEQRTQEAADTIREVMAERPVLVTRAPAWHKFNFLAFYPHIVDENVIRVSPLIVGGFNADHDGDAMNFHVPVGDKAVEEAKEKMLPSSNLFKTSDMSSPAHMPGKEMLLGLYQMTLPPDTKKKPVVFASEREAVEAYNHGLIKYNDPIIIRSK